MELATTALRRHQPANTLISAFQPPDCETIHICYLRLLNLWYVVTADLEN